MAEPKPKYIMVPVLDRFWWCDGCALLRFQRDGNDCVSELRKHGLSCMRPNRIAVLNTPEGLAAYAAAKLDAD